MRDAASSRQRACEPMSAFLDERFTGLLEASDAVGFAMRSDARTWELLRSLAASKPGGRVLETGVGTGIATFWLLEGLDQAAELIGLEGQQRFLDIAQAHVGADRRATLRLGGDVEALSGIAPGSIDLCFADGEPGKFTGLPQVLDLLAPGGIYVVDDLHLRPHWPEMFAEQQNRLLTSLYQRQDGFVTVFDQGSGMATFVKASV